MAPKHSESPAPARELHPALRDRWIAALPFVSEGAAAKVVDGWAAWIPYADVAPDAGLPTALVREVYAALDREWAKIFPEGEPGGAS